MARRRPIHGMIDKHRDSGTMGSIGAWGRATRRRLLHAALFYVACFLGSILCLAQVENKNQHDGAATLLQVGGDPLPIQTNAGSKITYLLKVPAGKVADLAIEQTAGSVSVIWTDADYHLHEPRSNLAGLHSLIRFDGLGPGEHLFDVTGRSPASASEALLTASFDDRNATVVADIAVGEEALAHAETSRVKRDLSGKDATLAAYGQAVALASRTGNPTAQCQALALKALYLLTVASDAQSALPLVQRATTLAGVTDAVEQASAWKVAGYVYVSLAQYEPGLDAYNHAFQQFKADGDVFNQAVVLQNRSNVRRLMGDFYGALSDAQAALPLVKALKDSARESGVEESLGSIYFEQGDFQHAYRAYRTGLDASSTTPNLSIRGYLWSDLGQLYNDLADSEAAQQALQQADAVWKATPNLAGQLATIDGYGILLRAEGKAQPAIQSYQRGLELARTAGLKREIAGLQLGLARVYLSIHDPAHALRAISEACAIAREIHEEDAYPEYLVTLADTLSLAGHSEAAGSTYHQALDAAAATSDIAAAIAAFGGLAHLEQSRDRFAEAAQFAASAINLIETSRERLTEDSLQTSYFSSKRAYYDFDIHLLMEEYRRSGDEQSLRQALLVAERARARRLLDQISSASVDMIANAQTELAAQHRELTTRLRAEQNQLAIVLAQGSTHAIKAEQLKVVSLTRELDDLEGRMREAGSTARPVGQEFQIEALQQGLGVNELALEYWVSSGQSYLWAIRKNSFYGYLLPAESLLRRKVQAYLKAAQEPSLKQHASSASDFAATLSHSATDANDAGKALRAALLPAGSLPSRHLRLIIVPDGPLFDVPFGALPTGAAGAPMVETNTVVEEPSLKIFSIRSGRTDNADRLRVALIADPVYSFSDPRASSLRPVPGDGSRSGADRDLFSSSASIVPRLAFSQSEAVHISKAVGLERAKLMTGFDASPESVRGVAEGDFNILHFAAHTQLNREHPDLSGILLSRLDRQGNTDDGILWYSDVCKLHLRIQLVVLSACESSSGRNLPGEGLLGLSYAFLVAGAPRVIGTLWQVDDQATSELMSHFYFNLIRNGGRVDEALRKAQLTMMKDKYWSHPYYWAGVVFEGDPSPVDVR